MSVDTDTFAKEQGRLMKLGKDKHKEMYCCGSDTPLIQGSVPGWFVAVSNNEQTTCVPALVKEKRFQNWPENARDCPLPVWISNDGVDIVVISSVEVLERLSGEKVTDLHRHKIDHITFPSPRGSKCGVLHRMEDVFDSLFESGSMPYAYIHYPFENKELFRDNFPGHFVAEGLDQTRGWFYTLMDLSTDLFNKPAFRNLISNGLELAVGVIDKYGADALRLYLINSPVVCAEPLRFKEKGVEDVVESVFLPLYEASRFLVQNTKRLSSFVPLDGATIRNSANVFDQWINSATQSLVRFVRKEMDAYRLCTVVPYLLKFIDNLTNIYLKFNRETLKGRTREDWRTALSTLYHVLLTLCKVMVPFTPFFTELLYKNLRKVSPGSEESIHFCSFPEVEGQGESRIEESVNEMMKLIDLVLNLRDRHNRPLSIPLWKITIVVHPDAEFLDDRLVKYVMEELNVHEFERCYDPLSYTTLRAEPDLSVLGKKLGESMKVVAEGVKAMSQDDILSFEKAGEITIAGHCLKLTDVKIVREFKRLDRATKGQMDASCGDVLVIMDLAAGPFSLKGDSPFEVNFARKVLNHVLDLRTQSELEPTEVEVYFTSLDDDPSDSAGILQRQSAKAYINFVLGSCVLDISVLPNHAVIIAEKTYTLFIRNCYYRFKISLSRSALAFNANAILELYSGNAQFANALQVYLLSRDYENLKSEFQVDGEIRVDIIKDLPAVDVVLNRHVFLTTEAFEAFKAFFFSTF